MTEQANLNMPFEECFEAADDELEEVQNDFSPFAFYAALKSALERLKQSPSQPA